jgi:hypothetical protein
MLPLLLKGSLAGSPDQSITSKIIPQHFSFEISGMFFPDANLDSSPRSLGASSDVSVRRMRR